MGRSGRRIHCHINSPLPAEAEGEAALTACYGGYEAAAKSNSSCLLPIQTFEG